MVGRNDWIIYVTDSGQENHFFAIFDAAKQAGWHREGITRLDHMGFGVVLGNDGKKFKTRSGETVKLADLLDESVSRAKAELVKRREEQTAAGGEVPDYNLDEAAENIGYAAVKYFDLRQNRVNPYTFSYEAMLDPKGDTAVYLFFAYARLCQIMRKAGVQAGAVEQSIPLDKLKIVEKAERDLVLELLRFPDVIERVTETLMLNQLTEYVYGVSKLVSAFYRDCKVIGSEQQESRLLLCESTRKVMEKCFFLLGCKPLERI